MKYVDIICDIVFCEFQVLRRPVICVENAKVYNNNRNKKVDRNWLSM